MNKIAVVIITVLAIILIGAVLNVIPYFDFYAPDDLSEDTGLFDYSGKPVTDWSENSHEFKFHQKISTNGAQNFENASIDVLFYKDNHMIGKQSTFIDEFENDSFALDFKIELENQPDAWYYNVTDVNGEG